MTQAKSVGRRGAVLAPSRARAPRVLPPDRSPRLEDSPANMSGSSRAGLWDLSLPKKGGSPPSSLAGPHRASEIKSSTTLSRGLQKNVRGQRDWELLIHNLLDAAQIDVLEVLGERIVLHLLGFGEAWAFGFHPQLVSQRFHIERPSRRALDP
jgi:hypothetical protein